MDIFRSHHVDFEHLKTLDRTEGREVGRAMRENSGADGDGLACTINLERPFNDEQRKW